MRWWLLLIVIAAPASAQADAVFSQRCPFGARERTSHAGPRCAPWTCATDAECEGGLVCRPWRVCVQTHEVPPAGLGAFRNPPPPSTQEPQVVGACAPDASCDGTERPRPPTTGQPVGAITCEVAPHCVRPAMPALPAGADVVRDQAGEESEQLPSRGTGIGSACGCRVGARPSRFGVFAILAAPIAIVARRRRR